MLTLYSKLPQLYYCHLNMETTMSLNSLARLPLSHHYQSTLLPPCRQLLVAGSRRQSEKRRCMVVEAKGKKGMQSRQFQRARAPPLPKLEDDGNPKFVIFIRTANVSLWYPLTVVTGGTTAKLMVAAKDNFVGKYLYGDTIKRNLAAVVYKDEQEVQKSAFRQYRVLRSATSFKYGYKLVEKNNLRAALTTSDVIELPTPDQLKTVVDKVKDFFGDATSNAKESFGKITALNSTLESEPASESTSKS